MNIYGITGAIVLSMTPIFEVRGAIPFAVAMGLNIWFAPKAILWHKVSKTIKQDVHFYWHLMGESAMIFFKRHYSLFSSFLQLSYLILRDFMINIKNLKYLKDFLMGLWHGFKQEASDIPTLDRLKDRNLKGL